MSSAEYAPVARGALKLKGVPQASKSHRKKRAKPEPSSTTQTDSKEGDRETTDNDKLERQIRSRSRDRDDQEHDDGKEEEQRDRDMGAQRERESGGEINPKEQEEIPISRGKTAAEMRHEERRKRKVWVLAPLLTSKERGFALRFSFSFRYCGQNRIFPPILLYPAEISTHLCFPFQFSSEKTQANSSTPLLCSSTNASNAKGSRHIKSGLKS